MTRRLVAVIVVMVLAPGTVRADDDLVIHDRVADGQKRADQLVDVHGPEAVVVTIELPVEDLDPGRVRVHHHSARLDGLGLGEAGERVHGTVWDRLEHHD